MMVSRHRLAWASLTLTMAAALAACSSRAPKTGETLDAADLAVNRAEQARVGDYAATDLRQAREKLAAAQDTARQAEQTKNAELAKQAGWLAEEARADADLASARAQQAKAQATLLQKLRSLGKTTPVPVGDSGTGEQP